MNNIRARLADTLKQYAIWSTGHGDWVAKRRDDFNGEWISLADVLLTLPDIGIVALPEPDMVGDFGQVWTTTARLGGPIGDVQYRPDGRIEIRDDYEHDYEPSAVRIAATILLAAANAAEKGQE